MSEPVSLAGVPETMLWTLHNRASEAQRDDARLSDPEAVRIYQSIDYDFERSFGRPDGSHAERSRVFDAAVRPWMAAHPGGTVVELGCGLETQFYRCDDGKVRWVCVDVPEAIEVRERFLSASDRCRHVARSALDPTWMDEVESDGPVFVTAQGLLMYFEASQVCSLVRTIMERFDDVELMFDAIPRWFSRKTMRGMNKTRHYQTPPMPWGINHDEIVETLQRWSPRIASVDFVYFERFRGVLGFIFPKMVKLPMLARWAPSVVRVRSAGATK